MRCGPQLAKKGAGRRCAYVYFHHLCDIRWGWQAGDLGWPTCFEALDPVVRTWNIWIKTATLFNMLA